MQPIEHLSVSGIQTYLECPLKFLGKRAFQWLESGERNELAMALGTAVHMSLTAHHRGGDAELTLLEVLNGRGANAGHGIRNAVSMKQITDMLGVMGKYTEKNEHREHDTPALWFEMDIPGLPIPFVGEFDLLREEDGNGSIGEWKTTSGGTWWSQERVDTELQATMYWRAYQMAVGREPSTMKYHIMSIGGPQAGKVVEYETGRDKVAVEGAEALVGAVWHNIQTAPITAACIRSGRQSLGSKKDLGHCSFADRCQYFTEASLGQITEAWTGFCEKKDPVVTAELEALVASRNAYEEGVI